MTLSVCLLRGHGHHQPSKLVRLCNEVALCGYGYKRDGNLLRHATRRWNQTTTAQRAHHEAQVENIRNIGIIAHVDAVCGLVLGKTTTTERMLYYSGSTRHLGNVDHGDTVTDFLPMERERGITIQSAAASFNWPRAEDCSPGEEAKTINLIDTPGHQDFQYEVLRCMPVLDGAVCVMDSVKGVEAHTERVWAAAQQFKIPRIIFVNKLDREGASFRKSVLDIATRLKAWPLVCQIPWWAGDHFVGVIDVIKRVGHKWSSSGTRKTYNKDGLRSALESENPSLMEEVELAREQLIERLCEVDDEIATKFADQGANLSDETIKLSIRRAISDGNGVVAPVFAGASLRNIGVEPLLDGVVEYLPSPQERPPVEVKTSQGTQKMEELIAKEAVKLKQKGANIAVASVFKVISDHHRGMLSFVRVYHGTLQRNAHMWNSTQRLEEKPLVMMQILANKHIDIPHLKVGGIGALAGLKHARTGDTLVISPEKATDTLMKSIQIRPAVIPPAVTFISIEPFSQTHEEKLEKVLTDASREDPSLRWSKDEKAGHYILSGMGLLHLEVAIDNLKKHKIDALFGTIQVDYKECISSQTPPENYALDRPVAGKQGKTSCTATIEPIDAEHQPSSKDFHLSSLEKDGNAIHVNIIHPVHDPKQFDIDTICHNLQNGAISALYRGPRKGYPLHGCNIEIILDCQKDYFGLASPAHYQQAGYHVVRNSLKNAHDRQMIGLLEPLMKVDIVCPESVAAQVRHDLASRHGGHVLETEDLNERASGEGEINLEEVYAPPDPYESISTLREDKKGATRMLKLKAKVPLKDMLDYDQHLRSLTEGRHSIQMELDTFERVTGNREKLL
ncbi:P-loop containing nucleoside triphosphate hydrolase protein [Cryphonectria parasitica EP155]|uniref:P-loop containing nucleoside triphosphate hydrolase protein n=1 Tax=Cryphonectria parasitica (strain ATCC 38755 / EP155) TaxID=660469 RepID=A0A9P4Y5R3_CRYP1|nr:P-loop containing nucleoside triphosphate hydrolase protein [Cryphonectria parasitica EP155]KAF3767422.1 P-loop containing nucleoside triphosphate hydrolase protein [Cryphonectria parasitica EP155]